MIRVGLLDSGVDPTLEERMTAAASFTGAPLVPDKIGHGSALVRIILHYAPEAVLLNAQAFGSRLRTSSENVAAALDWLREEGARLVNMSVGLREDRDVLHEAVAAALDAGMVVVASTPARGAPVFPAGYAGVLRITGDARCGVGEVSALGGEPADYGACPRGVDRAAGGASYAVAHVTGILATAFADGESDPRAVLDRLATHRARERRGD